MDAEELYLCATAAREAAREATRQAALARERRKRELAKAKPKSQEPPRPKRPMALLRIAIRELSTRRCRVLPTVAPILRL